MSSEKEKGEYDPNKKYRDFKWEKPDEFKNGPLGDDKRHCKDCLCCIIFVLFLCGCVVVCAMGVKGGDPNLVLYPYDEDGKQCGRDEYKDYKFLYFYNVVSNLKSFNTSSVVNAFCVKTCPDKLYYQDKNVKYELDCKTTTNKTDCLVNAVDYYNSTSSKLFLCNYFYSDG